MRPSEAVGRSGADEAGPGVAIHLIVRIDRSCSEVVEGSRLLRGNIGACRPAWRAATEPTAMRDRPF